MANTKLGEKHTCFHCEKKFYDFGKSEVVCPSCGADQKSGVAPDPEEELASKSEILEDELEDEDFDGEVDGDLDDDDDTEGDADDADVAAVVPAEDEDDADFEDEDLEVIGSLDDDEEDFGDDDEEEVDYDDVDDF